MGREPNAIGGIDFPSGHFPSPKPPCYGRTKVENKLSAVLAAALFFLGNNPTSM